MPFVWDEKYRLGIPEIDRQHQTLLLLLNKAFDFYSHISQPPSEELRRRALKDLASLREFARAHFATEEELMGRYDYPQLAHHVQEHGKFMDIVAQLEEKTATVENFRADEWIQVMLQWYDQHVQQVDRDMGEFLRAMGGQATVVAPVAEVQGGG